MNTATHTLQRWRVYGYTKGLTAPKLIASVMATCADDAYKQAIVTETDLGAPFGAFALDAVKVDDDGDDAVLRMARQRYGEEF